MHLKPNKLPKFAAKSAAGTNTHGTKQDRHLWEVKADFTKAIFVANCLGKRFFLVDGYIKAEANYACLF